MPGNFEWDLQIHAPDMWIAPFPSKTELKRTIKFGAADLKNGIVLKFKEYEEEEYFGYELPMVWMRVLNLPKVLRTYEVLWAVGTMFGATQCVDMTTIRKNSFGRYKVAVRNPGIVPNRMDVVIGSRFFELQVETEPYDPNTTNNFLGTGNGNRKNEDKNQDKPDEDMTDKGTEHKESGNQGPRKQSSQSGQAAGDKMTEDVMVEDLDEDDTLDDEDWVPNNLFFGK